MNNKEFIECMNKIEYIDENSKLFEKFYQLSEQARKITMELNNKYHTQDEIRELFSRLIDKEVDKNFRLFPPFYSEFLIGHSVIIATLNHDFNPSKRASMIPKKVKIGSNVWIGSNVTILPGVTIEDGAIVGAGSVVIKNVPQNAIVAGNPAKIIRYIDKE